MESFVINGGKKLNGEVEISGAKNAALKMLAATVLTEQICILDNVPRIVDIDIMVRILESIGAKIRWIGQHQLEIDPSGINSYQPDSELMIKMRASIVLAGPLLARFGRARMAEPGGCIIGVRPVYEHWNALRRFGVEVIEKNGYTLLKTNGKKLLGTKIILDAMSVTATENVIMAAVLAEGKTQIRVAASEPEIQDLVVMLKKMGAKISGEKTHCIDIKGQNKLRGFRHKVVPDRI